MKRIYGKSTRELMKDFVTGLQSNQKIDRKKIRQWFRDNYPKIKIGTIDAHITRMTVNAPSRVHYNAFSDGSDDLFIQLDDGLLRLYDKGKDIEPIYKTSETEKEMAAEESTEVDNGKEFAYEEDLKNFLAKNLNIIEEGLILYEDEGITGLEFDAGGRLIDILALDRDNNYVVIELKVSKGYDRVIGQLLRYIGWVKANLADDNQAVRGVIIARTITDDLKIACSQIPNVSLYEYSLSVQLNKI